MPKRCSIENCILMTTAYMITFVKKQKNYHHQIFQEYNKNIEIYVSKIRT